MKLSLLPVSYPPSSRTYPWTPPRHGQEGALAPWKCCKVLFVLQMLSKVSVDEVFMHYFEKMSSASGGFVPRLHRGSAPGLCWGISVLQIPSLPTPGKNPAGAYEHTRPCVSTKLYYAA